MSAAERPEPGSLDPTWSYLSIPGGSYYNFEMYRSEGLDSLNFVNPQDDPQPYELRDGSLDLGLTRDHMEHLRNLFTYLLDNWGKPEARESHPEEEK